MISGAEYLFMCQISFHIFNMSLEKCFFTRLRIQLLDFVTIDVVFRDSVYFLGINPLFSMPFNENSSELKGLGFSS